MLTPLDIQNKEFRRRLRGYCENEVDEFLDQILEDYEMLYRQNASLKDEVSRLKEETDRYQNLEETLRNTLVLAQKPLTKPGPMLRRRPILSEPRRKLRREPWKKKVVNVWMISLSD